MNQLPPHNIDAEKSVLGGILIDPESLFLVSSFLTADMFYIHLHGQIYTALKSLITTNQGVDVITVTDKLRTDGVSDAEPLVLEMLETTPYSINVRTYGEIVKKLASRRALIRKSGEIAAAAWDETRPVEEVLGEASKAIFDVTTASVDRGAVMVRELASQALDKMGEPVEEGIKTGFTDLDKILDGLHRKDLIIAAGRPGMGKSAFEGAICRNVALRQRGRVARFSLEMGAEQVLMRDISAMTLIDYQNLRKRNLTEQQMHKYAEALGRYSEACMAIDDTAAISPLQIESKCRQLANEMGGLDLVAIDYLSLMRADGRHDTRTLEVGSISRALKQMAKSLDVPVLLLAQLSRAVEQRADKHPQLSDLRDSGEIEQDADIVLFLYRDEYYHPDETERPNILEVNIAKHRNGQTGFADLFWSAGRISNLQRNKIEL